MAQPAKRAFDTDTRRTNAAELIKFATEFRSGPQVRTDGITSFTMDVTLPRNALVRSYDVVIQAKLASATAVEKVAQVRSPLATGSAPTAIILDFGTPRTVSGVKVQSGLSIVGITPWMGTAFATTPVFPDDSAASGINTVILRKEIRTERLLVEVTGDSAGPELWSDMAVFLPEAPTDLEIRIDGGAPVVSLPGPAQPGPDAALTDQAWNKEGERIVHLGDALAKLTGDPTRDDQVTFKVVLSSRVPGELSMDELTSRVPSDPGVAARGTPPKLSFIRRVRFNDDSTKELVFPEEGMQQIPLATLPLPENALIEEIRFTVAGTLPLERTIPADGPDDRHLADLMLSPARAACVRLRSDTDLTELTGVRLPLAAGSGGAEVRVVLWRPDDVSQEPVEAMSDGVSEPVTLKAAETGTEIWTTFSFKRPIPINQKPPWAVILVSRGEVIWSLGAVAAADDPIAAHVIRRGAPTGPWKLLPSPFQIADSDLGSVRGRIRVIGHAPKAQPVAPLIVGIGTAEPTLVTPTAKGVVSRLSFPSSVAFANLRVVSRVAGNVTLRDLDVVTTA